MSRRARVALVLASVAGVLGGAALLEKEDKAAGGTLHHPIDPRQQTAVGFGQRSHWLQPWRGYLDTVAAMTLRRAIGIQFNVDPSEANATARLLSESGFKRARIEIGWDQMSYDHPGRLRDRQRLRSLVGALARHGIRPLVLLNANQGAPCPTRDFTPVLASPAEMGAREVVLTPGAAAQAIPGRSGLDADGKAADVLFTQILPSGVATLSKPLPQHLDAGPQPGTTLRFEPFGAPRLAGGRANPHFEATLAGWLEYARAATRATRAVVGSQAFDVEVWNELTFGSDFLDQATYYQPPREQAEGDVTDAILRRTVEMLRGPSSPAPRVGIGNGFANQTPFPAGSISPPGLTAIDKHPYYGIRRFPEDSVFNPNEPLDALGQPSYDEQVGADGHLERRDRFVPRYDAFFPEYILTAIQTETMIRDLSPITTDIYGTPHGRRTHPSNGRPPKVWITEANLDTTGADPSDPSNPSGGPVDQLTARDMAHLHAKAALRYYTAFVNKGVSAVHLFAAKGGGNLALVSPTFFDKLHRFPRKYPGARTGGETLRAVDRLARAVSGAVPLRRTRRLSLVTIADHHGHLQFEGDGSTAHPPLYDRDVTAFLPFQVRRNRWVAAAYVMTRNLARLYRSGAPRSDPKRYDLPAAWFRLTIAGLRGRNARAHASDPLTGHAVPVKVLSRKPKRLVVELPLTDSPRLISLEQR